MKFDDLFNDFFKKSSNPFQNELDRIMKSLMNFRRMSNDELDINSVQDALGEPDEVEEFEEEGLIFKKMIWNKPEGQYVKIIVTDVNTELEKKEANKTLEEQLTDAVEAEDYELAIELREKIKQQKKNK